MHNNVVLKYGGQYTVQQIVLLRYRGSKITGLLYMTTLGYMDEIVRHGKQKWWQLVGSSLQGPS